MLGAVCGRAQFIGIRRARLGEQSGQRQSHEACGLGKPELCMRVLDGFVDDDRSRTHGMPHSMVQGRTG
jgi:hypothetical protein